MTDFMAAAAEALDRQAEADEAAARLRATIASLDAASPENLAALQHILSRVRAGIRFLESKGGAA